ncbi:hypothetical protein CXG81DRAFT_26943 [Caulochytrium protostelioides]|uniref:Uncharacterized protein n=1 Tax=Caulochytrium protostelioides TaxID=1555241 RepID=A0A4P9X5G6_9FUNG|nr:hypothetical protein CXG81DRAFT_26943 [Caulochytrium protostelioides]|eukprot:RKP00355.1 hypothetical protein CXG81DRAFT_26943 [Caulochytrium protostelioides]
MALLALALLALAAGGVAASPTASVAASPPASDAPDAPARSPPTVDEIPKSAAMPSSLLSSPPPPLSPPSPPSPSPSPTWPPTLAMSPPPPGANETLMMAMTPETCPVLRLTDAANHPPLEEGDAMDQYVQQQILLHPDLTMWDMYKAEVQESMTKLKHQSVTQLVFGIPIACVQWLWEYLKHTVAEFYGMVKYGIRTIFHPRQQMHDLAEFFKELKLGCQLLWAMFKEDPKKAAKNMAGGLLLQLKHHPVTFPAEMTVLLTTGFMVIDQIMGVIEMLAGTLPSAVSVGLQSVFFLIHLVDDPLIAMLPIIRATVDGQKKKKEGEATLLNKEKDAGSHDDFGVPYLPAHREFEVLPTCQIPAQHPARHLTPARLCDMSLEDARWTVAGTRKTIQAMSGAERVDVANYVHDFMCCYNPVIETAVEARFANGTLTGDTLLFSHPVEDCEIAKYDWEAALDELQANNMLWVPKHRGKRRRKHRQLVAIDDSVEESVAQVAVLDRKPEA